MNNLYTLCRTRCFWISYPIPRHLLMISSVCHSKNLKSYLTTEFKLYNLKRKISTNPQCHDDYTKLMDSIISKAYAEEVPTSEIEYTSSGRVWHLPHQGVYSIKKLGRIRVVFDCSSQHKGVSLNSMLLSAPDLTNSLVVVLRFRLEQVAVVSDVECIFYQVNVAPVDRDCLRFFWWPGGNIDLEPVLYRMTVHLFGATSSPSCANYALHQPVDDNREYYNPRICQAVERNFYVDDFLYSVPSEHEAVQLIEEISFLCSMGGFHLTKWMSNKRHVLETIDEHELAKPVNDLSVDEFPAECALGVHWYVQTDTLGSVYDPLGLLHHSCWQQRLFCKKPVAKGLIGINNSQILTNKGG